MNNRLTETVEYVKDVQGRLHRKDEKTKMPESAKNTKGDAHAQGNEEGKK